MRTERPAVALVVLGLLAALAAAPQPARTKKAPAAAPATPLVRKDLLAAVPEGVPAPRRDIFRPQSPRLPAAPPAARGQAPKARGAAASEAPSFALDLVYVGSIKSGGTTTALVMRNGQTTPLAVGDEIIPGYKVLRITPDEIEVEGPKSERRTFTRQGDRP
ncbi:MAG TPA: hypothetical protein VMS75_11750 [Terriglobales bacterium]|nr:hypothetical protein [Terriglobales bacterium]